MQQRIGLLIVVAVAAAQVDAAQPMVEGPYYERDHWLDITEWFDGNDYNPTDESWFRVDDEVHGALKNQANGADYGYRTDQRDWFYDYYDPQPYLYYDSDGDGIYDYATRYHDSDRDGQYDALFSYSDRDADGVYEDSNVFFFNEGGRQQAGAAQQSSRAQRLSGTIEQIKLVQVRGYQHVVATVRPQGGGLQMIVDLGRIDRLGGANPKPGDAISASGPLAGIGDKSVVLAERVELGGNAISIDRLPRRHSGRVTDTRRVQVRGQEHLLAMVELRGNADKAAVDLGPASRLQADIRKDSQLAFNAFPVKVNDRLLLMATSFQQGSETVVIERQAAARPAAAQQRGN